MYGNLSPQWSKRRQGIYPLEVLKIQTISRSINYSNVSLIETDSCLKEMNFFYGMMKVSAVYHLTRNTKTGKFVFLIWSFQTFYFLIHYGLLLFLFWFAINRQFGVKGQETFEGAVLALQFYVFNILLITPVLSILESKKMADYRNKWSMLQAKYTLVTGKILYLKMRLIIIKSIIVIFVVPTITLGYSITQHFMVNGYVYWEIILLSMHYGYILYVTCLAYGHWFIIMTAIRKMSLTFISDIKGFGSKESRITLLEYKDLWLDFSRLIRSTGYTFCYTMSLILIFIFILLTLAAYTTVSNLNDFIDGDWVQFVSVCGYSFGLFMLLSLIGISADNAVKSAGEDFQNALLELKSNFLMEDSKKSLEQFLQVLSSTPPVIDLGGFVVVNKSLNTSLMSTLVTYLIVLLQFKFSSPSQQGANKQPADNKQPQ